MSLKINATGLVLNFVNRYLMWRDSQNFFKSPQAPAVTVAPDGIPCFDYRDIDSINSSDAPLVAIDCLTEGIHSRMMFDVYRRDKKYLIFANGSWDREQHRVPINYVLISHLFFLFEIADIYHSPNRFCYFTDKSYNFDSPKHYDFVTTIGTGRKERAQLIQKLEPVMASKKCIVRYRGQDLAQPSNHLDVVNFEPGKFNPYIDVLEQYYYNVSWSIPMTMYNACRFNLVVETDIDYQHCFFLTEKTVKALLTGMPFVSMSHANFLSQIRKLGFVTYDSLWDESYDQQTAFDKRMDQVVQLCDQLCNFDWEANRTQLETIKLRNQSNFLNLNKVCDQEFTQFEHTIQGIT